MFRFIHGCQKKGEKASSVLTVGELNSAEQYWISLAQRDHFSKEILDVRAHGAVSSTSSLLSLRPLLDSNNVLRVGGRQCNSEMAFSQIHPIIIHRKHPLTKLILRTEHTRLLHGGPTLMMSSLCQRFHIVGGRQLARFVARECITCQLISAKPGLS